MKSLFTAVLIATGLMLGGMSSVAKADEHQHVTFTTYGQTRSLHSHDHAAAHQIVDQLRNIGCQAHMHHNGTCFEIHYSSTGGSRTFGCDIEAHNFANWLSRLGFVTQVVHH